MRIVKVIREEEICSVCDGTGTAVLQTADGEKEPVPCLCRCEPDYGEWLAMHGIEEE
mgnify:FL=1